MLQSIGRKRTSGISRIFDNFGNLMFADCTFKTLMDVNAVYCRARQLYTARGQSTTPTFLPSQITT